MLHCRFSFEPVGQCLFAHSRLHCPGLVEMRAVFDLGVSCSQGRMRESVFEYESVGSGRQYIWDDAAFWLLRKAIPYRSFWPLNAGPLNRYGHRQVVVRTLTGEDRTFLAAIHEHVAASFHILTDLRSHMAFSLP
jgi:hypothetical protein